MTTTYRRLYRVKKGKILCGLMQGLGRYFGVDPVILRIAVVGLMLIVQAGLAVPILYFIFALCVPYAPEGESE
jgi:phage shock protein C